MFVVQKEIRGKGIGRKLITKFEKTCKEQGINWIILYADDNDTHLNFIKKNGFDLGNKCIECKKMLN